MKKIFALSFSLLCAVTAQAQLNTAVYSGSVSGISNAWFDFQLAQHIGLNNWTGKSFVDGYLPRTSMTELRGILNLPFSKSVGAFIDMGVGIMPAPRKTSLNIMDFPLPALGSRYFNKEEISNNMIDNATANFKMTFGLFGAIPSGKLKVMPYAGIGFISMSMPSYEAVIKEDGSNMQYHASYEWQNENGSGSATLGYLTGRLNFSYPLSGRTNLLFGLEYTCIYSRPEFAVTYINSFNENIVKRHEIRSNRMNMLGISLGVSFR